MTGGEAIELAELIAGIKKCTPMHKDIPVQQFNVQLHCTVIASNGDSQWSLTIAHSRVAHMPPWAELQPIIDQYQTVEMRPFDNGIYVR